MAIPDPQSIKWPADRAILLVHGVGNAKPGDYDPLIAQLAQILAGQQQKYAIYMYYYDYMNEWFSQKLQAPLAATKLVNALHAKLDATSLGNTIASFVGDVIWPVMSLDARDAIRTGLLRQLRQVLLDASAAGVPMPQRKISIICHSLGCFHVFEALHTAASDPAQQLGPSQGLTLENVIFMASPVQLIRSVAGAIRAAVPNADALACLAPTLAMPASDDGFGATLPSTRRTVSITGNLDPVGGYVFRAKQDWAYMNLPGQVSAIDQEEPFDMRESDLQSILQQALQTGAPPKITPQNPHDWSAYVARHANDLKQWLP